jgi:NADPH-dependent glutamate synthase beta subunit-like oxidoreductase
MEGIGDHEAALVPCKANCPAGIDVPEYVRLVGQGKSSEAVAVIREKVPFPRVLGHICFHPCEEACRRNEINDPISICALKRFAAEKDTGLWRSHSKTAPSSGRKVAIVGGGPAGLTASFYLSKAGHKVALYEAEHRVGGMMWLGIPDYRLPGAVLQKDIDEILNPGIEVKYNARVGDGVSLSDLRVQYDAVFLSVGAQLSRRLDIEGSNHPDAVWGVDFLKDVKRGRKASVKDRVIVIGGGNVAIDVALTARRLGARDIQLVCLEKQDDMPAHSWECEDALAEGVVFHHSWGPKRIVKSGDRLTGIELVRCLSVFDKQGRFNPSYDRSTTRTLDGDTVIMAIGQACDLSFLEGDDEVKTTGGGLIQVDGESMETTAKGLFCGGDAAMMPGSVIDAIASGRKAASGIDRYLGGSGDIDEVLLDGSEPEPHLGRHEGFAEWCRVMAPCLIPEERIKGFSPIDLGFDDRMANDEAKRCLQCDLRLRIASPPDPPEKWLTFDQETVSGVPETEGVYHLLDETKEVLSIKGVPNLREALIEQLGSNEKASYLMFEEDRMYTQRESELIQQHLQKHGKLPGGSEDELEDLF